MFFSIFSLFACSNDIANQYQTRKEQILQPSPPPPDNWLPDIILRVHYDAISKMSKEILEYEINQLRFTQKVLITNISVQPKLKIQKWKLTDAPKSNQINFSVQLTGAWLYTIAMLTGAENTNITIDGIANVDIKDGQVWLSLSSIKKFQMHLASIQGFDLSEDIEKWFNSQLLTLPPVQVATIDTKDLPVRAIRINTTPQSQNIEILSSATHNQSIPTPSKEITNDWQAIIHQKTILQWAQQMAFSKGVISKGVAIDPVAIKITDNDFNLDLRLWKIEGMGLWWRDYTTTGTIHRVKNRLQFEGKSVKEGEKSPKAGLVDPLALLGEGLILNAISDNLLYSLPAQKSGKLDAGTWNVQLENFKGVDDTLELSGTLVFTENSKKSSTQPSKLPSK